MGFAINDLDRLIPKEFSDARKGRLIDGLSQFTESSSGKDKEYTEFYLEKSYPYFLQGDLIESIRFPIFNKEDGNYKKVYYDAILVSNTCDVDLEDKKTKREPKKALLAKLVPVEEYIIGLRTAGLGESNITNLISEIKRQMFSNIFYLPATLKGKAYLAYLDQLSTIELEEINSMKEEIDQERIATLDYFGYYLFIFKLSYHLLRLPEETHR